MKRKFIVPVCTHSGRVMQQCSFSSLSFLPHGVIVQVVEKPVESVDGVVSPLRVVYGREEKVLGIHELAKCVTPDSGRGKRRLKDDEGARVLEGLLQETCVLGASTAAPSNSRLHWRFFKVNTRSAHSRVVRRLLEVQGSREN